MAPAVQSWQKQRLCCQLNVHMAYTQYYIAFAPCCCCVSVHISQPLIFDDKPSSTCLLRRSHFPHTHRHIHTHIQRKSLSVNGKDSSFNFILIIKLTLPVERPPAACWFSNTKRATTHCYTWPTHTYTHTDTYSYTRTHIQWQINLSLNALCLPIGRGNACTHVSFVLSECVCVYVSVWESSCACVRC